MTRRLKPHLAADSRNPRLVAEHRAMLDQLRAQGDTIGNAYERGYAARLQGIDANPWFDADGDLIHIAGMEWRSGWHQATADLQRQPDLFAYNGLWLSDRDYPRQEQTRTGQ